MFINKSKKNYDTSYLINDISIHDGIPKEYHYLKDKTFGDWEIPPWELFIFKERLLGSGSFSNVYLAKWRETFVVAKVIDPEICKQKKQLVIREFEIMARLHHPNIVQFLGYIDEPLIIVMEYIPNGDLLSNINKLNKKEKIEIMKDILRGLAYIHNRKPYNLIHRDIKPTNILLTKSKVAKITDFGLSKFNNNFDLIYTINNSDTINNSNTTNSNDNDNPVNDLTLNVGTERYMAPECKTYIDSKNTTIIPYTNSVDIYSCGILLYELFENCKFNNNTKKMTWFWTPKDIRKLIMNMVNCNPADRVTALEILYKFV